ncbi:E3 ubiquitin-protein ligase TRIM71-like [Mytilus edulis]|uniref:E3 ubiquitin-protein ligase TRIM71-like n=1 Tax=Mytilus edulis TaxID=6550 RepID=UPI0039F077C3
MAKNHTFVSGIHINPHSFLSGPNINPEVKQFCKEHDENFIYYCKECNMPICKICVIKKHKSHDFAEIKESTDGIRDEVKRVLDMQIGNLQSKISDIEQDSNKYQSNVNVVIHAIREEGKHLKEQIDMNVESLVRSVKQKETKNLETLRSIENEIKTALNKAKEQQKIYQDTQGMKDTTKLIQQLKQINSQICLIDEKPILAMPFVKYSGKKVPGSEIKNLFGDLTFGIDALRSFKSRHRQETENDNRPHEATENENQQPAVTDVQENECTGRTSECNQDDWV